MRFRCSRRSSISSREPEATKAEQQIEALGGTVEDGGIVRTDATGQNAAGDAALFRRADTTDYAEVAWDEGQKSIKVRR